MKKVLMFVLFLLFVSLILGYTLDSGFSLGCNKFQVHNYMRENGYELIATDSGKNIEIYDAFDVKIEIRYAKGLVDVITIYPLFDDEENRKEVLGEWFIWLAVTYAAFETETFEGGVIWKVPFPRQDVILDAKNAYIQWKRIK